MDGKSDAELMRMVHEKQRSALEALYDKYVKLVYSFAMKATRNEQQSREIVQLVFMRLWTTSLRYDPDKGLFINWLITITRNIVIDYLRSEKRKDRERAWSSGGLQFDSAENAEQTEDIVIRNLQRQRIRRACRELSEKQAQLIDLLYWQGYTLREIAEQNNEPLGTVKSRLHYTLKLLRDRLNLAGGGIKDAET